jgi:hypothetical protein
MPTDVGCWTCGALYMCGNSWTYRISHIADTFALLHVSRTWHSVKNLIWRSWQTDAREGHSCFHLGTTSSGPHATFVRLQFLQAHICYLFAWFSIRVVIWSSINFSKLLSYVQYVAISNCSVRFLNNVFSLFPANSSLSTPEIHYIFETTHNTMNHGHAPAIIDKL